MWEKEDDGKSLWDMTLYELGILAVLKFMRLIRFSLAFIICCMLYFGPLSDEFRSDTISYRVIEENNECVAVIPSQEKEFRYIDHDTYEVNSIIISSNNSNISSKVLDQLLLRWLVDPSGMESSDTMIEDKKKLLLMVSSPDFWAQNYQLHGKQGRISWWMWVHQRYLYMVRSLQNINDKNYLLSKFKKVIRKLGKHSYYEEIIFYPFLEDNYEIFQLAGTAKELRDALNTLGLEHIPIHKQEDVILEAFEDDSKSLDDIKKLMLKWQRSMEDHFLKEEQTMIHLCLKFPNHVYRRYLYYITPGYLFHAMESFIDYSLNLFYIID